MVEIIKVEDSKWPAIVQAFRADFGLSQRDLQAELQLSDNSPIVSQWESGYRKPKQYLYLALAGLSVRLRRAKRLQVESETWTKI